MADLKPISQFATASSVEANTLLFVSTPNQNNGYDSEKVSASELGEALVNDFEYTQDLSTVSKKVTGAINEQQSVIGYSYDAYDATTAYSTGDLCIYNNTLYKALQATTGNLPTNTTYWEQTSIADEINELNTGLSEVKAYRCKYAYTSWGTSKGSEYTHVPFFRVQIDLDYYIASNGGDYINIRNLRTGTTQGGQIPSGQTSVSVTVDGYTFTKNVSDGKQNLVITTSSNKPIFIEYYL